MGNIAKSLHKVASVADPIVKTADSAAKALGLPTPDQLLDGPKTPDLPAAPATTPQDQSDQAAQQAALAANAKAAELSRQRRAGSVLAGGAPAGSGQVSSVLAYGKARLGD